MNDLDHLIIEIEQWANEAARAHARHKEEALGGMDPDAAAAHGRIYDAAIESLTVLAGRLREFRYEQSGSTGDGGHQPADP